MTQPQTVRSALERFFGVALEAQTYRNLAYLLLAFPLGITYFTVVTGGSSAGVSMLPILVGVPVLVAVLAIVVVLADLEALLARRLLGVDVAVGTPKPDETTLTDYVAELLTDPRSYLAVGYLLSKFVVGIAAFAGLVTAAALSVSLVLAPIFYQQPGTVYMIGGYTIDTLPGALTLSVGGGLLAFVSLHVFNGTAWLLGEYTKLMLGNAEGEA
jgi:hypothetical protein